MDRGLLHAPASPLRRRFESLALAAANAAAVGSLYLNQALLQPASASLPTSMWLALIPFATLAGYALGVSLIAFGPARRSISVRRHMGCLVFALLAAAAAPNALTLAFACVGVGAGAAVAQRILAAAAHLAGPAAAGRAIGRVIACGLTAVLLVKLVGAPLAGCMGWRMVFAVAAILVAMTGFVLYAPGAAKAAAPRGAATGLALLRSSGLLRRLALQQALLFAAFQGGWLIALTALPIDQRLLVVFGGGSAGLLAAMQAGWFTDRADRARVALVGSLLILAASLLALPLGYGAGAGLLGSVLLLIGMVGIDSGLQVALVANQARAQSIHPALRTRCAALLTVGGSIGGGIGAAAAYCLYVQLGWMAGLVLVASFASAGFLLSVWPGVGRLAGSEKKTFL